MASRRARVLGAGSSSPSTDPYESLMRENTLLKQQLAAALTSGKARRSDMDIINADEYEGGEVSKVHIGFSLCRVAELVLRACAASLC